MRRGRPPAATGPPQPQHAARRLALLWASARARAGARAARTPGAGPPGALGPGRRLESTHVRVATAFYDRPAVDRGVDLVLGHGVGAVLSVGSDVDPGHSPGAVPALGPATAAPAPGGGAAGAGPAAPQLLIDRSVPGNVVARIAPGSPVQRREGPRRRRRTQAAARALPVHGRPQGAGLQEHRLHLRAGAAANRPHQTVSQT